MSDTSRRTIGVVAYLILAFGLAWGPWELLLPASSSGDLRSFELRLLPGAFAPMVATFIVRSFVTREGYADAGLGLHLKNWPYYLIGWFLPLVVVGFIVFAAPALGLAHPDFTMTKSLAKLGVHKPIPAFIRDKLVYILPVQSMFSALVTTPLLFGEEFGWRGYLQLRLFPSRPTLAAIATGIIWGLWHWPVIRRGYEFPGDPYVAAAVFCGGAVLISIIFGWLRRRSGSVWATSLAHAATNGVGGSLIVLWFPDRANPLFVNYLGFLGWVPLGLFALWIVLRGEPNSRS